MKTQRKAWFVDKHAHTYTIVSILICICHSSKRLSTESRIAFFFDWMAKRCLPISEMPIKNKQKRIIMQDNQKKKLHDFFHFCFIQSNILKKWKMFWFLPYDNFKFFLPYSVFSIIQIFSTIKFSLSSYSFSLFFSKESLLYSINFQ